MLVSLTNLYCWRVLCAVPGNVVAWTVFPTGYELTLPSCHHCRLRTDAAVVPSLQVTPQAEMLDSDCLVHAEVATPPPLSP
eukprot:jgi/Botrbrau1/22960/Bobra.0030s0032.1